MVSHVRMPMMMDQMMMDRVTKVTEKALMGLVRRNLGDDSHGHDD